MTLPPLSLRGKLFAFAALLILGPGLLLSFLADRSARDSLQRVIGRELAREALHTADRVSVLLRAERETLASFARQDLMREIRVADLDKRIALALATLRDGAPGRADYLVVDARGSLVAASSPHWYTEAGRANARQLRDAPGPYLGPLSLGSRRVLALSTSVPDPDGGPTELGVLVGLLEWSHLEKLLAAASADLAEQGMAASVTLVDADGAILASAGSATPAPTRPAAGHGYGIDRESSVITGAAPLDADVPPWRLLVIEPLDHALAPAQALTRRLAITTVLALAGALVLATLSARRVVRPLSELTEAIRATASGRLGTTTVPVRSDDEVGELARSFNQMASDLDDAQKHLVEAEKFAFVGELASGVAHEVRTSLGVLRSSAQMLERSLACQPDPEIPELVGMIRDEVGRLGGVVDDLLTLDRPRAMHFEPTPLSQPLIRAAEFVEPQAREKRVALELTRTDSEARPEAIVACDREALQHACVNLLVNAVRAVPAGGHVALEIDPPDGDEVRFRIEDDGPGIPRDLRDRVFDPFVTARDTGVGLGLTFVKRTVHEHGGRIRVRDGHRGGACFEITLPLAGAACEDPE